MPLLRVARDRIAGLMMGSETCHWGDVKATIWVATNTGVHSAASSWPSATTAPSTMESGFPSIVGNIIQFRSVYSTAQANFQWESWWIHTATASGSGIPLNHAPAQALGTKTSAQSWQLTACVTVTT